MIGNTFIVRHNPSGMILEVKIDTYKRPKPYVIVPILIDDRPLYDELIALVLQVWRLLHDNGNTTYTHNTDS